MSSDSIISSIKDSDLVAKRREQIVKGALTLFKQKGFHRTTTREIAKQCGFSIGTLYEYIRTKEDVLFLVFEAINDQVYKHLETTIDLENPSVNNLMTVIESYYRLMDKMQEEVIILYQELKSLQLDVREIILQKEKEMVAMLKEAIIGSVPHVIKDEEAELLANNIIVQGHMWGFRRWILQKHYTIEQYINLQTSFILNTLKLNDAEQI